MLIGQTSYMVLSKKKLFAGLRFMKKVFACNAVLLKLLLASLKTNQKPTAF